MLRFQVAGFPLRVHRRLEVPFAEWQALLPADVSVRLTPSQNQAVPEIGPHERRQIEANIQEGFTHIVTVPYRRIAELVTWLDLNCRVTRLAIRDAVTADWDAVQAALDQAIAFEQRWCSVVRPPDLHHPLLLPPIAFVPVKDLRDFWRQCNCYGDTAMLDAANSAIQKFRGVHRKSEGGLAAFWQDSGDRRFVIDPARHARAPAERAGVRRFRFCYEVPNGFHYDVTHRSEGRFTLNTPEGPHAGIVRANVDPWGSTRGIHR